MKRRKNKYLALIVLLLAVTLGYAAIQTTLKINGTATVNKHEWNIYWGVPQVTAGSVTNTAPTREADGDNANAKLTWSVTLDLPGDYYEFTVDAINAGDVDAMIADNGITNEVSPALPVNPAYIKYEVTFADGSEIEPHHVLRKADQSTTPSTPTTEKYKVRVYYDENAATAASINGMTTNATYTFTFGITYVQYVPTPEPEETWDTYYYLPFDEEANDYSWYGGETTTTFDDTWSFWARENSTKKQVCGRLANGPVCVEAPENAEDMANIKNIVEANGASCMDSTNGYFCEFYSETLDNLYITIEINSDGKEVTFDDAQYTDGAHDCYVYAHGTIGCD